MKTSRRWIDAAIREAANDAPRMPWERGARRAAFIAKRDGRARAARAMA